MNYYDSYEALIYAPFNTELQYAGQEADYSDGTCDSKISSRSDRSPSTDLYSRP